MVLENAPPPFFEWLPEAMRVWVVAILCLGALVVLFTVPLALARHGAAWGLGRWWSNVRGAARDLVSISPRRVFALAKLAVKESLRQRILAALVVFALVLLFAGWFLAGSAEEGSLYIQSIFSWQSYLVLFVTLLVSCLSLPTDIKQRTIYTVVTKPVRASEIVLGRILGFTCIGAALLGVMALLGYFFLARMVDHTHEIIPSDIVELDLPPADGKFDEHSIVERGRLAQTGEHHHTYQLNAAGEGRTDASGSHWHVVTRDATPRVRYARLEPGDATRIHLHFSEPMDPVEAAKFEHYQVTGRLRVVSATVSATNRRVTLQLSDKAQVGATEIAVSRALKSRIGRELGAVDPVTVLDRELQPEATAYHVSSPLDTFRARIPSYGRLSFNDRNGDPRAIGISVGSEWTYRSYIEGATPAAAIWTFDGVTPEKFGDALPLELTVRVFRTHKGRIDRTVRGSIVLRNPDDPARATSPRQFFAKDGAIDSHLFPRKQRGLDPDGQKIDYDLYRDLAPDGKLQIVVQCIEGGQFFGMAQADAYLVAREGSFALNYLKTCLAQVFQVALVAALGVMFSTFLSGPVAILASLTMLAVGWFKTFVGKIVSETLPGGGPFEAAYRLNNQMNLVSPLEPGLRTDLIKFADARVRNLLDLVGHVAPNFRDFWLDEYLAAGFQVPGDYLAILAVTTIGYVVPVMLLGYLFLRGREVAR
jgi:hypothetical protein